MEKNPITEVMRPEVILKNIIETNVILKTGKQSKIITVFNQADINFEEIIQGINEGLSRFAKVESSQSNVGYFHNKKIIPSAKFPIKHY